MVQILSQCKHVLNIPINDTFAWTNSTIVLSWLQGSPHRFKVFVGNRVAQIMELIPPERWKHVGEDNPADCASRGMYSSEILNHTLWWSGPEWLKLDQDYWPKQSQVRSSLPPDESEELCSFAYAAVVKTPPLIPFDRFSTFSQLVRVTAFVL